MLAARFVTGPHVLAPDKAEQILGGWLADLAPEQSAALAALTVHPLARTILLGLAEFSPICSISSATMPIGRSGCCAASRSPISPRLIETTSREVLAATNEADVMRLLRHMKSEAALLIALCDIGGVWPVMQVTAALTEIATSSVQEALRYLLRQEASRGRLSPPDKDRPEAGCGLFVLAMGKMGAGELNYSSDIDLIVFFDADASTLAGDIEPQPFFVRVTQALARLLQQRTGDGYVFRVDLRLRPDPASTQVAMSTDAALNYYEREGRTWERAAMIKARICAGDAIAGERMIADLAPFVWRKHLDFAALADVHDMKRQMQTYRGQSELSVEGHNVKVGRGGIREIEFFAQTQQLIAGGRHAELRVRPTLDALGVLASSNWITLEARDQLTAAYLFLRRVEHRLQMVADEQTHSLPDTAEAVERFACFLGYDGRAAFAKDLLAQLDIVQGHYGKLFEGDPTGTAKLPDFDYAAGAEDQRLLEHLTALGFKQPVKVAQTVQIWMTGEYRVFRNEATRSAFNEFVPALIGGLADAEEPDHAVSVFDRFPASAAARRAPGHSIAAEPRDCRARGAGARRRTAARRHAGAAAAIDGRADRSALFRRDAGPARAVGAVGRDAEGCGLLRGVSRPAAPVRPGEPVPDRHPHPVGHGLRAPGRHRLCRRGRRHRQYRAWPGVGTLRVTARPHQGPADRRRCHGPPRQPRDDGLLRSRPHPAL